jgi:TusA-related sulfurtransferase
MSELIDAKGLGCAEPVILAKKALESCNEITIVVNESAAMENLRALGTHLGCSVEVTTEAGCIHTVYFRKKVKG